MKKLFGLIFVPGLIMALIFFVLGDTFESALSGEQFIKKYGQTDRAWAYAVGLMFSDLLLPIPASGIMSAIGSIYGFTLGFLINFLGSFGSGLFAYFIARKFGKKASEKVCSPHDLEEFKSYFDKYGSYAIIISRLLPILPEVLAITAGLTKMDFKKFTLSLFLGTTAVSILFTTIGVKNKSAPTVGILLSVVIPLLLWISISKYHKKRTP
ncbi:MAG: VTT domain-containing protein [Lentisphaeraceae bacterium]|nr:VTT domain-containing protein [Lentisphaeraceae bacterium]